MSNPSPERKARFSAAINAFLMQRCQDKRDKLPPGDPRHEALLAQHAPPVWLEDAARRVMQIQAVTHTLKAIHPEARGTNLYCPPQTLPPRTEVGSHSLTAGFSGDVVGNAAALDVYKFLKIQVDGLSVLDGLRGGDVDLLAALSHDPQQAEAWRAAFVSITLARGDAATHGKAKQLYWLVGDDPQRNDDFHLLAPLYASSLAHAVYRTIDEDRFGDAAKAARTARRERSEHPGVVREYPQLAVQKLGGTKPQNVSQLNSERRGNNYLLASLPPTWKSHDLKIPHHVESIFPIFGRLPEVRRRVIALRRFLLSDPDPTIETRDRRDYEIEGVIDELVAFAAERQSLLTPGWSAAPACDLAEPEKLWLDPGRMASDAEFRATWVWMDWPDEVGKRFGNWLNGQLSGHLPVGDIEQRFWADELIVDPEWAARMDRQRKKISRDEPMASGGHQ